MKSPKSNIEEQIVDTIMPNLWIAQNADGDNLPYITKTGVEKVQALLTAADQAGYTRGRTELAKELKEYCAVAKVVWKDAGEWVRVEDIVRLGGLQKEADNG